MTKENYRYGVYYDYGYYKHENAVIILLKYNEQQSHVKEAITISTKDMTDEERVEAVNNHVEKLQRQYDARTIKLK
ncbi:MAG: hypothetical protein ACOC2U_00175 [bacterium]